MKTLLKNIASIRTGLFAKPIDMGEVVYLQSKHFDENGDLLSTLHPDLMAENISEQHLLKDGDVLFAAKGSKNFAALFEQHNEPAVASTSFFVLRLTDKKVLPAYLAWFLNHDTAQKKLKRQALGTSIPSISKQVLENLEVSIPGIETQIMILKINNLQKIEKDLKQKIDSLREKEIQAILLQAVLQ